MEKTKKKLSIFQNCWIIGSIFGAAGIIISDGVLIWIGLGIIATGIIASVVNIWKKSG